MTNRTYLVTWEIEVDASSPVEAARQAQELQQHPTTATVFSVCCIESEEAFEEQGSVVRVDLSEVPE